jgi:hypothetical protein
MLASLLKLLSHQLPTRPVWTADLTYWIAGQPTRVIVENGWDTEAGHLRLCQELGLLPYYWYENFWAGALTSDQTSIQSATDTSGLHTRTWTTPPGNLTEESRFVPESRSQAITRYPVQTKDDLKILLYHLEHAQVVPANLDSYPARRLTWASFGGLPSLALPRSPLPAFLTEWAGVQHGIYLLLDEPVLVGAVLDQLERLEAPVIAGLRDLAAQIAPDPLLVHFADNLTSEVYTPFFTAHMADRYSRRLERLHAASISCAVHLDGTVRGLLPRLAEVGIDAIEALTPQPVGDVAVEEMRQVARNAQVILWGGVPGAMFSPPFTWPEVERHVRKTLTAWEGTPFILGTADQVPPDGDIDFVKRISELVASL